jgi:hypothetical protein
MKNNQNSRGAQLSIQLNTLSFFEVLESLMFFVLNTELFNHPSPPTATCHDVLHIWNSQYLKPNNGANFESRPSSAAPGGQNLMV